VIAYFSIGLIFNDQFFKFRSEILRDVQDDSCGNKGMNSLSSRASRRMLMIITKLKRLLLRYKTTRIKVIILS